MFRTIIKSLCLTTTILAMQPSCAEDLLSTYRRALNSDPQLKTAELKVELGKAQNGQALGRLLPQISGTANWSVNDQQIEGFASTSYQGTRYFVSLTQSLIDLTKYWDWKRAQKVKNQYRLELDDSRHTLMVNVVERYFAVLDAEDRLRLTRSEIRATETELEQVKKRYAKQLVKVTDVYEAEASLDQLKADEIEAHSQLMTAKLALKELTDYLPERLDPLRDGIEYKELEGRLDDWIAVAIRENPALVAQQSAIEAARNNVAMQKAQYLPVVDLQLNFYDTDTGFQSTQTNATQTQVAAINVNVPIFTGGTTTHRMYEAQSRLAISKEENKTKIRALIKEVSDAFSMSNALARRIKASEKALVSANKSAEAMQKGLQYGVVTTADVLRAKRLAFKARKELSGFQYEYITNRVRFLKAIGTISEENMHEINAWLRR